MNIEKLAKQWLIEHEHYEHEPTFKDDLESLISLVDSVLEAADTGVYIGAAEEYDPLFGDNRECLCDHTYYRHFDSYTPNMDPIGCKYCRHYGPDEDSEFHGNGHCTGFKEKIEDAQGNVIWAEGWVPPDDGGPDDGCTC